MPINLTVVVLACDEEQNLPGCLESVKDLGCEVFVVDSGSTDRTMELAKLAAAQVVEHHFENYAAQRNWAQRNLPITSDWVLHLDADERLTPELIAEVRELFAAPNREKLQGIDGFLLCKRTLFMGRWMRHGAHYPSYHLRLFRREKGACEARLYDQHFLVNGAVARLSHDFIDVLTTDLNRWTERHLRWAELEARQLFNGAGGESQVTANFFGNPIEKRRWLRNHFYAYTPLFVRPLLYWLYRYFFRLGFLDGKEGLVFHFLQGLWFRLLVDVKLDELRRQSRNEKSRASDQRSEIIKSLPAAHL